MKTHAYCRKCEEESAIDTDGTCLWCGTATGEDGPEFPTTLKRGFVNGPGFIAWLHEVRPDDMAKGGQDGPSSNGGRGTWADDSDLRAIYRAEKECGTMHLAVADRLCVKLGLHIDVDMPEHLWCDAPQGRPPRRVNQQTKAEIHRLKDEGLTPSEIAERLNLRRQTVSKHLRAKRPAVRPGLEGLVSDGRGTLVRV